MLLLLLLLHATAVAAAALLLRSQSARHGSTTRRLRKPPSPTLCFFVVNISTALACSTPVSLHLAAAIAVHQAGNRRFELLIACLLPSFRRGWRRSTSTRRRGFMAAPAGGGDFYADLSVRQ